MEIKFFFPLKQFRRRQIRFVSAGSGTEYINDVGVRSGYIHKVERVAIENLNNAFTRLRIGAWDGSSFHLLVEQTSPSAAVLYWTTDPFYLSEDERLRVEIVGATANDVINVYIDEFYSEAQNADNR